MSCTRARVVVALVAVVWAGGTAEAVDGLIARWTLEDGSGTTAVDSVGSNNGTLVNCDPTLWSATGGHDGGGALGFDGFDDHVNCGTAAALNPASLTVAFWMRANGMYDMAPLDKLPTTGGYGWAFRVRSSGEIWFRVGAEPGVAGDNYSQANAYQANTWVHVSATFDDATKEFALFINGAEHHRRDWAEASLDSAAIPLYMSKANKAANEPFNGMLQDVRMYDRALTGAEIIEIMSEDLPVVTITATDATAAEAGADVGVFTVSRVGSTSGALTVDLLVDETDAASATSIGVDADYSASPDVVTVQSVTIADGEESATVTITPDDDVAVEGDETVTVAIAAGATYVSGSPAQAVVTIADDDGSAPGTFDLTYPIDGVDVPADVDLVFAWTQPTGTGVTFELVLARDASFTDLVDTSTLGADVIAGNTFTLPHALLDMDETYHWSVEASNVGGTNGATNNDATFDTSPDATPPTVLSTTPVAGDGDVDVTTTVTVVFSEPMDATTTEAAFALRDEAGAVVTGATTWSADGASLTFSPDAGLDYDLTYTVSVTDSAVDLGGVSLDGNGDAVPGWNYVWTFGTHTELAGLGAGAGCTAGSGRAPLALAALLVVAAALVARSRRLVRAAPAAAVALFVGMGCTGGAGPVAHVAGDLSPRPLADLSSGYSDEQKELRWSPRGGAVIFIGGEKDVAPRATVGAYTRFVETDERRVELALELAPGFDDPERRNMYVSTTGDYVVFLGDGTFFLKAGGGCAFEFRDDARYVVGLIQCGGGMWIPIGRKRALVVNGALQLPVGEANPRALAVISAGYEF